MICQQSEFQLSPKPRGFNLVTTEVVTALPAIGEVTQGILSLFIKHTSASLTVNEGVDPSVRVDLESHMNRLAPEDAALYTHDDEGLDDMPAHIKNSLIGSSITIPISHGQLNMGTWQGIYLCEHRNHGGTRTLVASILGT